MKPAIYCVIGGANPKDKGLAGRVVALPLAYADYCTTRPYPDQEICYAVCSKLSWSHNRLIMRADDPKARAYYLADGAAQQWSVQQLERNIQTHGFQRLLTPLP